MLSLPMSPKVLLDIPLPKNNFSFAKAQQRICKSSLKYNKAIHSRNYSSNFSKHFQDFPTDFTLKDRFKEMDNNSQRQSKYLHDEGKDI